MTIDVERRNAIVESYHHLLRPIAASLARRLPGVSLDDLVQAGALGLLDAAAHYSPDREASFGAYVRMRIRGAMLDSLDGEWGPELPLDGEADLRDERCDPFAEALESERRKLLARAAASLSGRQRRLVLLRCESHLSQRAAAAELGVSQAAVAQLEQRAIRNLRAWIVTRRAPVDYAGMGKLIEIPRPTVEQITAAVDELGALSVRIQELRQLQERYEQLRRKLLGWYEAEPAGQSFALEGAHFAAEISARSIERRIRSMLALYREIGQRRFLKYCQFPLSALDEIMAPADQERFVVSSQTGPRRIKVFARLESAA